MDGELIVKRDDTQEAPAKLRHCGPKTKAIVLLWLAANRAENDADAHVLRKIGASWQNIVLEVGSELKIWHSLEATRFPFAGKARSGLTTPSSATAECGAAPAWWAERRRRKQVP